MGFCGLNMKLKLAKDNFIDLLSLFVPKGLFVVLLLFGGLCGGLKL